MWKLIVIGTFLFAAPAYAQSVIVFGNNDAQQCSLYTKLPVSSSGLEYCEEALKYGGLSEHDRAVTLMNRGINLKRAGRYDEAMADYEAALKLIPELAEVFVNRGVVYAHLKQYERAIEDFDRAIFLDPEFAIAYRNRGYIYDTLGQYERSIDDYDEAIRLDSEYAETYYGKTKDEKRLTAYHEAGHALMALSVNDADPLLKATILPRGKMLGMITQLPERNQLSLSLAQMKARMAIIMGGRVAEEVVYGNKKVTSGTASDIEQATKLARAMVARRGMSEELGPPTYGDSQEEVSSGQSVTQIPTVSEETARRIDAEIRRIVDEGYATARSVLQKKTADLHVIAEGLLTYESLSGDEIRDLLTGKKPSQPVEDDAPPSDEPTAPVPTTTYQFLWLSGG